MYNIKRKRNMSLHFLKGVITLQIVESDKIKSGKRIKIGNLIIIGTKEFLQPVC
jgi:predicted RecA/RadA family phage recombinase